MSTPKKSRASQPLSAKGLLKAISAKRKEAYDNIGKKGANAGHDAYWVGRFAAWREAQEMALRLRESK